MNHWHLGVLKTHSVRRKIPSTAGLVAFEAAARHQSFTLAGEELALTQSAIGRQIASLEHLLGVKLFRRTRRGILLTAAGLHYSESVRQRLGEVERDARDVAIRGVGGGALELGVVPTFATHWLIPRLARFSSAHPDLQVNLHVHTRPFLFDESGLDAAIHAGRGGWPGTQVELLMPEDVQVICSPALLSRRKRTTVAHLAALPLIQMTTRPNAWREWFLAHGAFSLDEIAGPRVELFSMAVQAAIHGLGIALVPVYAASDEIRRGLLVAPIPASYSSGLSYYFIRPEGSEATRPMAMFRDWILREATSEHAGNQLGVT